MSMPHEGIVFFPCKVCWERDEARVESVVWDHPAGQKYATSYCLRHAPQQWLLAKSYPTTPESER